jgi:hypothetical protein
MRINGENTYFDTDLGSFTEFQTDDTYMGPSSNSTFGVVGVKTPNGSWTFIYDDDSDGVISSVNRSSLAERP